MKRRGWSLIAIAALYHGGAAHGETEPAPVSVASKPPIVSAVKLRLPGASAVAEPPTPSDALGDDDAALNADATPGEKNSPNGPSSNEAATEAPASGDGLIAWTHWKNGRPTWRGAELDGAKQGPWTRWFHASEGPMFDDAEYVGFERPFISEVSFVDGLPDGLATIIDRQGRKMAEFTLVAGQLEGAAAWYYADGHARREVSYHEGQLTDHCRDWDKDHQLVFHEVYERGRVLGHRVERYPDKRTLAEGDVYRPGNVVHAQFDWLSGEWRTLFVQSVAADQRTGTWKWLYPNGLTKLEGVYRDDQPMGKFTWYTTNAQKQRQGTYVDGTPTGVWSTWHANGQKEAEGQLIDGQPTGVWMGWDQKGRVHAQVPEAAMTPPALPE